MKKNNTIQTAKIFVALLFVGVTHLALGSFTGSSADKSKEQFSLKNFNRSYYKSATPFSLRSGFEFKNIQVLSIKKDNGTTTFNSIMRYERGNTAYIYPYKHKVTIPKFVTPTPPAVR